MILPGISWCGRDAGGRRASGVHVCRSCVVPAIVLGVAVAHTCGSEIVKYGTFETNVRNTTSYSNPFQDVTLTAAITSPSSQNYSIRGFYDGNNTWRIRFMPDQIGTWTYNCSFSDGSTGKSGSFQCVAGDLHGPLRTDPVNPLWFEHADGTPFFIRAFHLWRPESFTESVLDQTLDFMKANGFNVVDGPHLANWGEAGNQIPWETGDYTRYKLRVWQELDVLIRKCAERDIVVMPFSILGGTNGVPKMSTWDQRQRFIRYWVARWGGFWNITYCPTSEYDEAYSTSEETQILNEIYSVDGGRHPVTTHPGNADPNSPQLSIKTLTSYTFHTIQDKLDDWSPARYQRFVTLFNEANKPLYGQECLWEGNKYQPDSSRDMNNMRKAAWVMTANGGQISYADECMPGHLPMDNDETLCYDMHGAAVEPQGWFYPYFQVLGDFVESTPYWRMSLQPGLASTGNCLAKTDYWYLAYTLGGSFTLNLSAASSPLIGRWFDPRTGEIGSPFSVSPGGVRTMNPPDSNDWVLYVCRDVDSTPPAPVSAFSVTPGEHRNTLVWTNPSSADFIATVIRCSTTGYPISPDDGEAVVNLASLPATTHACVHAGLNAGATYYYTAFARDDEYHYASGVQASGVPFDYRRVAVDLGTTNMEEGLYHVVVSDGVTVAVDIGGKNCRRNAVAGDDNYMYFDVADAYMYAGYRPDCYVTIEYYDTGTGSLTLQYDATASAYKSGPGVSLANSNTWKKSEFHVTDAYFGNRQNNGADFRIAGPAGALFYLNEVSVADVSLLEVPPVINPPGWQPDAAYVGAEYVRELTLAQGRPSPCWSLLQGPPGAVVDGGGRISGFVPTAGNDGQAFLFEVQALNSQGSDTVAWQVNVSAAPLGTYEAEAGYCGHQTGSAIPGGWRVTLSDQTNVYSTYGPYTSALIGGPLRARFWLRVDDNSSDNTSICRVDVHDADGGGIIAGPLTITRQQWTAAGVYQPFDLPFTNPGGGHRLEFRTYYLGGAQLDQDRVDIFPAGTAAPLIAEVTPDPDTAMAGSEYIRQLALLQGYPSPTWTVLQGPAGLQVSSGGMVYGWSPSEAQNGQTLAITIRAVNTEGSDDESWNVTVEDNLSSLVFEDTLVNASKITGQRGSGSFSADGYTLTRSVSDCSVSGNPRSGDFVYYELNEALAGGSWAVGTIEFDLADLASGSSEYPHINEFIAVCDSYGLSPNPAWDKGSYYNSNYRTQQRRINYPGSTDKAKPCAYNNGVVFEQYTSVLEWNATTVYRFRITWGNGRMRWYRGIPGNTLEELVPPGQFSYTGTWAPRILHIQLGSTFRAYRTSYSGGDPGDCYSLIRVYNEDLGGTATPVRGGQPVQQAPVINEVLPDPDVAAVGIEYIRTLTLAQGYPAPSWSLVQGPAGMAVDGTGRVHGWVPSVAQAGHTCPVTVRAENSQGSDDESWSAIVLSTIAQTEFTSGSDSWALAGWQAGTYGEGSIAWDSAGGNPGGNIKCTGSGSTNNNDSCTREGGMMTRQFSTSGYENIGIAFDLTTSLYTTPASGCIGTCVAATLEGTCEDKLVVHYSTSGTSGPWSPAHTISETQGLPAAWTTQSVSLAAVTAAADNANFAIRLQWQFNTATDTGRIDKVRILGTPIGLAPPAPASNPSPPHQATNVSRTTDLSWTPGSGAASHDVYFGTQNPPAFQCNQVQTTFGPGWLDPATTYYWRIDERNDNGVATGSLWQFSTGATPGDFDGDGDVDQEDFGFFQACLSGTGQPYATGCAPADLTGDNDVDDEDFGLFNPCMGGADKPPGC